VCTVGADKLVNYWDLRNTKAPVFSLEDSTSPLMNCDFLPNDQQVVTTSIAGEISVYSVKR
jgi:WD40 repeat protein